ncbi:MAG: FAD:protein FMN transferase [Burkholderiales bacterium]
MIPSPHTGGGLGWGAVLLLTPYSLLSVFLFSFLLAACGKEPLYQEQSYVFGTLVEISIYGTDEARAKSAARQVLADFDRLHQMLHAWKPGALSEINSVLAKSPARTSVTPELAALIRHATALAEQSDELFNPAIGKLVGLWGFHRDEFLPVNPAAGEIARIVAAHPRMSDVVIEGNEIYSNNPQVQLDFGGYAKGYALDVAAAYLRAQGVNNALINIGGNILALGRRGNRAWRVGIQHPRKPAALATLELRDGEAIGTSGDYQRYFERDEKRYCHIIDPRSGQPVPGVQAVTIVITPGAHAGAWSDAASKPLFIEGVKGWRAAATKLGVEQAMLIDERGEVYITPALKARLEWVEKNLVIHEIQ